MLNSETILGLGSNQLFVKSYIAPDRYLSHRTVAKKEVAQLAVAISPEDLALTRLKVSRGVADQTDISLESGVKPSHYLRPAAPGLEELIFSPPSDDPSKKESVFKVVPGLGSKESGWISFESRSRPNWFIMSGPDGKLFLRAKTDTDAFRQSATFRILGPSNSSFPITP